MLEDNTNTPGNTATFEQQIDAYRLRLMERASTMQAEYDKSIIALAGGALGLSIGLLKDIFGRANVTATSFLVAAWICWAISLTSTLYSYHCSAESFRNELEKLDKRVTYIDRTNRWDAATVILNSLAGILFLLGILLLIIFLLFNPLRPQNIGPQPTKQSAMS